MDVQPKAAVESKTNWFNLIMTGVLAASQATPQGAAYGTVISGVALLGNFILRNWFTKAPVTSVLPQK